MNSKKNAKHARRVSKLNAKPNRCSQHRRNAEGKSNIGVKRLTLLPGFLINGFSSSTAKKATVEELQKTKDQLLSENLQAFLERKSNLRRSERILKKRNKRDALNMSSTNNDLYEDLDVPSISNVPENVYTNSVSIKSILKKNSKSIFKEISDKFSKVHIQNNLERPQIKTNQLARHCNEDLAECHQVYNAYTTNRYCAKLVYNHSICEDFFRKIHVTLKKDIIQECQENIKKEANMTNLVLEGRVQRKETVCFDSEGSDSEAKDEDNVLPIPEKNWVYCTPLNQKIIVPQAEECQVKHGLMCVNNNRCNLYEVYPKPVNNTPANMFIKKVDVVMRTPVNFESTHPGWNTGMKMSHNPPYQAPFIPPYSNAIDHQMKIRMPNLASYLQGNLPIPETSDCHEEHNFTFVENDSNFRMHGSKRPLANEDEFVVVKKKNFNMEPSRCCEKPKMFDFNSQERSMFDFGVIM